MIFRLTMKKEVLLVTLLIFLIFLTGCSKDIPSVYDSEQSLIERENEELDRLVEIAKAANTKNPASCDKFSEEDKKRCIYQLYYEWSLEGDNVDICRDIEDEEQKTNCMDNFYFEKASTTGDPSHCNNIIDSRIEDLCTGEI